MRADWAFPKRRGVKHSESLTLRDSQPAHLTIRRDPSEVEGREGETPVQGAGSIRARFGPLPGSL
eukprot:6437083-Pyramimonas_sp.AAC.1